MNEMDMTKLVISKTLTKTSDQYAAGNKQAHVDLAALRPDRREHELAPRGRPHAAHQEGHTDARRADGLRQGDAALHRLPLQPGREEAGRRRAVHKLQAARGRALPRQAGAAAEHREVLLADLRGGAARTVRQPQGRARHRARLAALLPDEKGADRPQGGEGAASALRRGRRRLSTAPAG